jgi:hypothetical protein
VTNRKREEERQKREREKSFLTEKLTLELRPRKATKGPMTQPRGQPVCRHMLEVNLARLSIARKPA